MKGGILMKKLMGELRKQVLDPKVSPERVADITSLVTCGYVCGGDNEKTIEQYWSEIIRNVDLFLYALKHDERAAMPNGVLRRCDDAYAEALAYREKEMSARGCDI